MSHDVGCLKYIPEQLCISLKKKSVKISLNKYIKVVKYSK